MAEKFIRLTTYNSNEQVYPQIKLDTGLEDKDSGFDSGVLPISHGGTGVGSTTTPKVENKEQLVDYLGINNYVQLAQLGTATVINNGKEIKGVATLDASGKVSKDQIPGSIDDIVEVYIGTDKTHYYFTKENKTNDKLAQEGEPGILYVDIEDKTNNTIYRWSGSKLVPIPDAVALGTGDNDAYPGNMGYNNDQAIQKLQSTVNTVSTTANDAKDKANAAVKGISIAGKTVTITRNDGTSFTQTTQDNDTLYGFDFDPTHKTIQLVTNGTTRSIDVSSINTHSKTGIVASIKGGTNNAASANGNTYINVTDDTTYRAGVGIKGGNEVDVSSDNNGNITVKDKYEPYTEDELVQMWASSNVDADASDYSDKIYGIEYDASTGDEPVRVGNMALHKSLPIQSKMKGCLLSDNGTVNKYLNADSWLEETRDGSAGQVMVEIPTHYRLGVKVDDNKRMVLMSEYAVPGFIKVPKCYVSAYPAALQRSTLKLASVVNTSTDYRGGDNTAAWDGTYRSLLGMPATSISRESFRKYARNRNTSTVEWNMITYDIWKEIYWLYATEYCTLNSQKAYNAALTSEGYHQGGLGDGITYLNYNSWNTYNGVCPFVQNGYTDSLGNGTGEVNFTMPSQYGLALTMPANRYRGIEIPFGEIWYWVDGVNINDSADVANGGDGTSNVYVCKDPSKFSDTGYDGYTYIGNEARLGGWTKEIALGDDCDIIGTAVGGSSIKYFCDYHYVGHPTSGNSLRGFMFGGSATHGANAGFAYSASYWTPSSLSANFGSRLCFLPN